MRHDIISAMGSDLSITFRVHHIQSGEWVSECVCVCVCVCVCARARALSLTRWVGVFSFHDEQLEAIVSQKYTLVIVACTQTNPSYCRESHRNEEWVDDEANMVK